MYVRTYVSIYVYACMRVYVYMYVCMCVSMYMHACVYIRTRVYVGMYKLTTHSKYYWFTIVGRSQVDPNHKNACTGVLNRSPGTRPKPRGLPTLMTISGGERKL